MFERGVRGQGIEVMLFKFLFSRVTLLAPLLALHRQ